MSDFFKSALSDFASDVASGDAIRHLADKGMTVREISENLTYPTAEDKIRDTVWKHYLNNGTIRLQKPDDETAGAVRVDYVLEYDAYGRSSYRRVEEQISDKVPEYVACDFGRRLYKDRDGFVGELEGLNRNDRDYILDLPWPLETVYHIRNERIERINACCRLWP